jgi:pilus assembly protein TadC
MAHDESIADLLRGALNDARDLVREEVALAKAEVREEVAKVRTAVLAFAAAALLATIGLLFALTALARGVAVAAGWNPWVGFALVALVLIVAAAAIGFFGYGVVSRERHMPRTQETLKENMAWMRGRTS